MSRPLVRGALALTIISATLGLAQPAQALPEIVQRSIEHHGGDVFRHSETTFRLCSGSGCYELRVLTDGGRFEHEARMTRPDRTRRAIVTNDGFSLWEDGVEIEADADLRRRRSSWVAARVYFPFLPFRLADPDAIFDDRGIVDWNGRPLHEVKVTFPPGSSAGADDEFRYWFDPDTARMTQFAYSFSGNPGGLRLRRATDCQRVEGLLFCDQTNHGVDGDGLTVDDIDPPMAEREMRPVSVVEVKDLAVRRLD